MLKILFLLAFLITRPLFGAEEVHQLEVTGSAVLYKPADQFSLTIGVVTNDKNADKAISANAEKMQQVQIAIQKIGIKNSELQTGNFTTLPLYMPRPKDPPADWTPTIIGYEVRNTLSIKTENLAIVGKLINASANAGANLIEDLAFSLKNMEEHQAEAIRNAVKQARMYAEAAADGAKVSLGEIIQININPVLHPYRAAKSNVYAAMSAETPVTAGNIEVSANVSVTFEIKTSH